MSLWEHQFTALLLGLTKSFSVHSITCMAYQYGRTKLFCSNKQSLSSKESPRLPLNNSALFLLDMGCTFVCGLCSVVALLRNVCLQSCNFLTYGWLS